MNFAIVAALALFFASDVAAGGTKDERDSDATQVAKAWFESLMQGETVVTTSLSDVPFDFDRKQQIKKHKDLKKLFDKVVETKGRRDLKPSSIKIKSSSVKMVEVVLMIEEDNEGIIVKVKPGEPYRVFGFGD